MPDAFVGLRSPTPPVDPDPQFATHLRARLSRALALPAGVLVSTAASAPTSAPVRHGEVGYAWLAVPDLDRAVTFHTAVLGWTMAPGSHEQGRQVQGRTPHLGLSGGAPRGTLHCCYAVTDLPLALTRVQAAGGRAGEPSAAPYGLVADCTDDQGAVFALYQPPPDAPATGTAGPGDLVYVTYRVVDSARFRAFYSAVLGWEFSPGGVPDGWQVSTGAAGCQGGHDVASTLPMWLVDDLAAAVAAVRAAGGVAVDPVTRPYGLESLCTDDQGTAFYLGQLP